MTKTCFVAYAKQVGIKTAFAVPIDDGDSKYTLHVNVASKGGRVQLTGCLIKKLSKYNKAMAAETIAENINES